MQKTRVHRIPKARTRVRIPKEPKRVLRSSKEDTINENEASLLLAHCKDVRDFLIVLLPLRMGLRCGEVQHLQVASWIDFDKKLLLFSRNVQKDRQEAV